MLTITDQSFLPSKTLVLLLYDQTTYRLSPGLLPSVVAYSIEQLRISVSSTLYAIRERKIYGHIHPAEPNFWVVDRDCVVRSEIIKEIQTRSDLHCDADFDSKYFKLRLGEELYSWFLKNPEEANKQGLQLDNDHYLTL